MSRFIGRCLLGCSLWTLTGLVQAQPPSENPTGSESVLSQSISSLAAYLPPEPAVREALLTSPLIQAARARKQGWVARARGIEAGPAEFTLRSTGQRRRDGAIGTQMFESMVSIERPVRFWGKRGLDADLSAQTQAYADVEYADALYQGARELMRLWFVHLRALADQRNAAIAFDLASRMQRLTQVQFKQGEISQLDRELADAEFERISATLAVADAQLASAAAAFTRRYPEVRLTTRQSPALRPAAFTTLPMFDASLDALRSEFLQKNRELNMMRSDAQRLRMVADRALRERLPDPTVGVFSGRERAGAETISGVMLSIPIPGAARWHNASAAVADAQAANDRVLLAEQQLGAMFEAMWLQFQHKREAAENLKSAAQRQALAAEKSVKAYTLGEGSLSGVLLIARQASDNLTAAERMQLDVAELMGFIVLDLQRLWNFGD